MKTTVNKAPKNQQRIVIISKRKNQINKIITKIKNIMKKLKLMFVLFAAIALGSSCNKTPLTPPPPPPPPSCNTVCQNGGTVNTNCGCNCPAGFTGTNCGTALTLRSVTVTRIDVINFPRTYNSGQVAYNWDPGTDLSKYPDIYININAGTTSTGTQSSAIYSNVNSVPQTYTIDRITLPNPSSNYSISMYDYDGLSVNPQYMGGIYFRPIDVKTGYPVSFPLTNAAGTVKYIVYVTWNF